jgi:hypothetical protein
MLRRRDLRPRDDRDSGREDGGEVLPQKAGFFPTPSRRAPGAACTPPPRGRAAPASRRRCPCRPPGVSSITSSSLRHSTPAVAFAWSSRVNTLRAAVRVIAAPRAVAARVEALGVALPPHDVRARAHAARDDPQLALARAHRALAGHDTFAVVLLAAHVVVVAVHRLQWPRRPEPAPSPAALRAPPRIISSRFRARTPAPTHRLARSRRSAASPPAGTRGPGPAGG